MQGGAGITVTGVGSSDRPYTISAEPAFQASDFEASVVLYALGEDTPLNSQSVFNLDFLSETVVILLPDGTTAVPLPPFGSSIDINVNGTETAAISFGGAAISWRGATPTDPRGWYRFVLLVSAGTGEPFWLGTYIG